MALHSEIKFASVPFKSCLQDGGNAWCCPACGVDILFGKHADDCSLLHQAVLERYVEDLKMRGEETFETTGRDYGDETEAQFPREFVGKKYPLVNKPKTERYVPTAPVDDAYGFLDKDPVAAPSTYPMTFPIRPFKRPADPDGYAKTGFAGDSTAKASNPKDAIGSDKIPHHLWPASATIMGTLGLTDGMLKYGRANWREAQVRFSIYYDAIKRHLDALNEGEDIDPDSGLDHMSHILASAAIIVDAKASGDLIDDRQYKGGFYRGFIDKMTKHVARLKLKHADKSPKHYTIRDNKDGQQ